MCRTRVGVGRARHFERRWTIQRFWRRVGGVARCTLAKRRFVRTTSCAGSRTLGRSARRVVRVSQKWEHKCAAFARHSKKKSFRNVVIHCGCSYLEVPEAAERRWERARLASDWAWRREVSASWRVSGKARSFSKTFQLSFACAKSLIKKRSYLRGRGGV